jgi:hypothetical protein
MSRFRRLLALDNFEVWRPRLTGLLILTSTLLVTYWIAWFADRRLVASDDTAGYIAFEQAFPLADAWLAGTALVAAIQLWRRRQSALMWLTILGGAGMYLFAMDVLYDLQHGIYTKPNGGNTELAINIATAALSIGVIRFSWRFRQQFFPKLSLTHPRRNHPE